MRFKGYLQPYRSSIENTVFSLKSKFLPFRDLAIGQILAVCYFGMWLLGAKNSGGYVKVEKYYGPRTSEPSRGRRTLPAKFGVKTFFFGKILTYPPINLVTIIFLYGHSVSLESEKRVFQFSPYLGKNGQIFRYFH